MIFLGSRLCSPDGSGYPHATAGDNSEQPELLPQNYL